MGSCAQAGAPEAEPESVEHHPAGRKGGLAARGHGAGGWVREGTPAQQRQGGAPDSLPGATRRPPPQCVGALRLRASAPSPLYGKIPCAIPASSMADIELTLPARAENVAVVRHAIGGLGEALDLDPQTLSDVKLAVTEACTNVVVHAYDGGEGPMQVAANIDPDHLIVVVRDEGRGIVPRPDSPGLGLGLPLIATLTESLELGKDSRERTEVRMSFRLGDAP